MIEIKALLGGGLHTWPMARNESRPRIAIVVNDGPLLNALAFLLEADGWEAAAFRTAAELLAKLPRAQCLLVDHRLPDMDGLSLISTARGHGMTAPALIIAGKPGASLRGRAASAGIDIIEKPLVGDEVRERIRVALDRAG